MNGLNYYWRLFTTGLCFSVFGIGGVFLTLTIFPLHRLIYRDEKLRKQKARRTVHYSFKGFIWLMDVTGTSTFSVEDRDVYKNMSGRLVLANHPSLIDVVVLISLIPNADCVVKAHLFKNPFMRGVIRNTGYISNANPDELIEECKESLEQGNNLIIFPEGTRTTPGQALKFQRGAANIALRCNAQLLTVLIKVSPTTLTKSEKWYEIPERRFDFSLRTVLGAPEAGELDNVAVSKQSRQYTRQLEQYFTEELKKYA